MGGYQVEANVDVDIPLLLGMLFLLSNDMDS